MKIESQYVETTISSELLEFIETEAIKNKRTRMAQIQFMLYDFMNTKNTHQE